MKHSPAAPDAKDAEVAWLIAPLEETIAELVDALEQLRSAAAGMPLSHDNLCQGTLNHAIEEADTLIAKHGAS